MPEQKGLLTKESVQRTIKSKWFLPALGVGGAVVVLLIIMNKRSGGTSKGDESIVPEETNMEAPLGTGETSDDLSAMFDELAGSISTQNQQQQEAIQAQLDAQNAAIQQTSSQLQGELASAISGLASQQYIDPYASGAYASPDAGYGAFAEPSYSSYGMDDTGSTLTPVLEQSSIEYMPIPATAQFSARTASGQAAEPTKEQLRAEQLAIAQAGTYQAPAATSTLQMRTASGQAAQPTKAELKAIQAQNTYQAPAATSTLQARTASGQAVSKPIVGQTAQGIAVRQTGGKSFAGTPTSQGKITSTPKPAPALAPKAKAQAPPPPKVKAKK